MLFLENLWIETECDRFGTRVWPRERKAVNWLYWLTHHCRDETSMIKELVGELPIVCLYRLIYHTFYCAVTLGFRVNHNILMVESVQLSWSEGVPLVMK